MRTSRDRALEIVHLDVAPACYRPLPWEHRVTGRRAVPVYLRANRLGRLMRNLKSTGRGRRATSDTLDAPAPARDLEGLGLDILARASPDGICILDWDGRVVYASPAYCAMLGHPIDRVIGQDALTFIPERFRQTALTLWADGRSEPLLCIGYRADGSDFDAEVRGSLLELQGRRFVVLTTRDVTERQRQARQAAALAQAAASVAANDSIDAILEAISECALAGTRALAAWVKIEDEDELAGWVGAAGVPDEFRQHLRSGTCAASGRFIDQEFLVARPVVVYADWRRQMERALGTTCPLNLPWQPAAIARLLHRGEAVGLLTAIFREGEMPYEAETTFLAALADQAAIAAANARLLAAAREKVALEERQRLARELHDSVSQSLYAIQVGAQMARERL